VDIKAVPDVLLRKIMENRGVKAGDIDIIIDSIMDWKDPDDLYRLSRAKSGYYQSLENPYSAKNSRLETPEEVILVR
jgi:general secretion pathway protein K